MSVVLPAPELPAGARSALVIATGRYEDKRLAALRSPAEDAAGLAAVLGDPRIGAFAVTSLAESGVHALRVGIEEFLAGRVPEETVLIYVSCHGVLSARRRLYFAARDTNRDRLASTAIEAHWLIDLLDECRARRQVVVLDCCFSGAFAQSKSGAGAEDVGLQQEFGPVQGRGRTVLTASRATEFSFEGEALADGSVEASVFTAALTEGLRTGGADTDGDGLISVSELYNFAYARVTAGGAAQTPQRWVYGGEGEVMVARSAAGLVVVPAPLSPEARDLLEHGRKDVRLIGVKILGEWLTDPDRRRAVAARLELERIVGQEHPEVVSAARALLTAASPERIVVIAKPPPRFVELIARAVDLVGVVDNDYHRLPVLAAIGDALVDVDPEWAARIVTWIKRLLESLAESLADVDGAAASVLRDVLPTVVRVDAAWAEQAAEDIEDPEDRAKVLAAIVAALADSDPAKAVSLAGRATAAAGAIGNQYNRDEALGDIARAVAGADPEAAERIASGVVDDVQRVELLCDLSAAVAPTHPARAGRLVGLGQRIAEQHANVDNRADMMIDLVFAIAATDGARPCSGLM